MPPIPVKEALPSVENVAEIREMWPGPFLLFATLYPRIQGAQMWKEKSFGQTSLRKRFLNSRTCGAFPFECAPRLFKRGVSMQCLPNIWVWVYKKEMKHLQTSHLYKWGNWVLSRLKYFHRVMQVRAGLEDKLISYLFHTFHRLAGIYTFSF